MVRYTRCGLMLSIHDFCACTYFDQVIRTHTRGKCVRPGPNHVSNHTHRESTWNRTYVKFIGDLCQVFKQRFYLLKLFAGGQFVFFSLDFQWKINHKIEKSKNRKSRFSWKFSMKNRFFEFFENFDFLKFSLKIQWKFWFFVKISAQKICNFKMTSSQN